MFVFDKRAFKREKGESKNEILEQIHTTFNRLCQNKILSSFIKSAKKSDFVFRNAAEIKDSTAMAAVKETTREQLYIDLICAEPGKGRMLEEEIEKWATRRKYASISLRAANRNLIAVYERWGFKRVDGEVCGDGAVPSSAYEKDSSSGYFMSKCLRESTPEPPLTQRFRDRAADLSSFFGF